MKRVCIIGTGYVGVASAIGFATLGHHVVGYDIIEERVRGLALGETPYHEAGLASALAEQLASGRLRFEVDFRAAVEGSDVIVVAVGTPSRPDGSADLGAIANVVASLREVEIPGCVVVVRSTVPPGTSERIAEGLGSGYRVVYAPEFLREGTSVQDFLNPDRIVVGVGPAGGATEYCELLASLDAPMLVTSYRNAELIKGCSNAFLAMKISFANEIANLCDEVGGDALDVLTGVGADRRIGSRFLHPGIGFGGPCFEKDLKSLRTVCENAEVPSELVSATLRVNERQPMRVVDILTEELGTLVGAKIGIWGLAFKGGTDDIRDSLAPRVIDELISCGAEVRAYDPAVSIASTLVRCSIETDPMHVVDGADALVVLTDWPTFALIPPVEIASRLRRPVVVDGRNILDPHACRLIGLRYNGIGRRIANEPASIASSALAI